MTPAPSQIAQPLAVARWPAAQRGWSAVAKVFARLVNALIGSPRCHGAMALGAVVAVVGPVVSWLWFPGVPVWTGLACGLLILVASAALTLPRALAWSDPMLGTLASVAIAGITWVAAMRSGIVVDRQYALAGLAMIFTSHALLLSPSVSWRSGFLNGAGMLLAWMVVSVLPGASLLWLAGMMWLAVWQVAEGPAAAMVWAFTMWACAMLLGMIEASRSLRWAARLAGLSHAAVRLGAVLSGVVCAVLLIPGLQELTWRAAYATPLEGLADAAGILAGVTISLPLAGVLIVLPGLLARWQLNGRLSASAARACRWFAACALLGLGLITLGRYVAFGDQPTDNEWRIFLELQAALALAVLAHCAIRLALGRPRPMPETPLWLVLPDAALLPVTRVMAEEAARAWTAGPITLLAQPAAAPRLSGIHQRLARLAGTLDGLFLHTPQDAAAWQRALPAEGSQDALPCREAYARVGPARALIASLPAEARVMLLSSDELAPEWAAALSELPLHHDRISHVEGAPEDREGADLSLGSTRRALIRSFLQRHPVVSAQQRLILVLHRSDDSALAERLVRLLDAQTDPAGRELHCACLRLTPSVLKLLDRDDENNPSQAPGVLLLAPEAKRLRERERKAGTLLTAYARAAIAGRFGAARQWAWRALFPAVTRAQRLELLVIESDMAEAETQVSMGLNRIADSVISLLPASPTRPLYPAQSYRAILPLPEADAANWRLDAVARRIVDESYPLPGASPAQPGAANSASTLDPIAEAEAYMAFGRFEQAEQLLLSVQQTSPHQSAAALKMLELYRHLNKHGEFSAAVVTLFSQTHGQGPAWDEAIAQLNRSGQSATQRLAFCRAVLLASKGGLGPEHATTVTAMLVLADALSAANELSEARALHEEIVAIHRRTRGDDCADTWIAQLGLAETLRARGNYGAAEAMQLQALNALKQILGPGHPDTRVAMLCQAATLKAHGDAAGAEALELDARMAWVQEPDDRPPLREPELSGSRAVLAQRLAVRHRMLGATNEQTSIMAWALYQRLRDLGEAEAASLVLREELLWLVDDDTPTLGEAQEAIRQQVRRAVGMGGAPAATSSS